MDISFLPYPPNRVIKDIYAWDRPTVGCYPPHYHPQTEIMYIVDGRLQTEVDFTQFTAEAGDVVLLFPNQIHRFMETWGAAHTWIFIFDGKLTPGFSGLIGVKKPVSPVIRNFSEMPEAESIMQTIIKECDSAKPFAAHITSGALTILMGMLLRNCPLQQCGNLDETTASRILHFCCEHFAESISLTETAKNLRLSPYYLSRLMPQKFGLSFVQLITSFRLDEAVRQLQAGKSVTVAALDAGFSSTRTFHRAFRERYGVSPSEFLNS